MYRVILDVIEDPHFTPPPSEVLYETCSEEDAVMFAENYVKEHEPGWYTILVQKQVQVVVWKTIKRSY